MGADDLHFLKPNAPDPLDKKAREDLKRNGGSSWRESGAFVL